MKQYVVWAALEDAWHSEIVCVRFNKCVDVNPLLLTYGTGHFRGTSLLVFNKNCISSKLF